MPKLSLQSHIEFTERWRTTECYALKLFVDSKQIVKIFYSLANFYKISNIFVRVQSSLFIQGV